MTAFVSFVQTFAVWIYLLCGFGILFAIKMLVDAQRLSRTTLFSLEQERASEQTYRALIVMLVFFVAIVLVTLVIGVLAPIVPAGGPVILRGATATIAPLVLPTNTRAPTVTLTPIRAVETPVEMVTPIVATLTRIAKPSVVVPVASPSLAPVYTLPAPKIIGPVPNGGTWIGEGQANAAITFKWSCDQCILGQNDWYEVVIVYVDKSGMSRTIAGRTQDKDKLLLLRKILEGGPYEIYQKAKEDTFQWFVQVKREPGNQPLSPPSEAWKFVWK